jgi:hypothetical protein
MNAEGDVRLKVMEYSAGNLQSLKEDEGMLFNHNRSGLTVFSGVWICERNNYNLLCSFLDFVPNHRRLVCDASKKY